jgi:hypothetical protein
MLIFVKKNIKTTVSRVFFIVKPGFDLVDQVMVGGTKLIRLY